MAHGAFARQMKIIESKNAMIILAVATLMAALYERATVYAMLIHIMSSPLYGRI